MDVTLRIAALDDVASISQVILRALNESNAQDYSPEIIAQVEQSFSPDAILRLLSKRQVYVATLDDHVVATASLDGDVVRSVFVHPGYQGLGIGKQLMGVLEHAAIGAGINMLRVPSSITAEGFYAGLGFQKNRDEFHGAERTVVMEKLLGR